MKIFILDTMPLEKDINILIYNNQVRNPLYRNFAYHVPYYLDYKEMQEATKYFLGTHDFSAFMASNSAVKTTIRTINKVTLERIEDLKYLLLKEMDFYIIW